MLIKIRLVFSIAIVFFSFYCGFAQNNYWKQKPLQHKFSARSVKLSDAKKTKVFSLDQHMFINELSSLSKKGSSGVIIYFPNEEGVLEPFKVKETPVFSPGLTAKYPTIRSYSGIGLTGTKDKVRFSVSHNGIKSMVVHTDKRNTTFMQKTTEYGNDYMIYNRNSKKTSDNSFVCRAKSMVEKSTTAEMSNPIDDQVLRKFRVAISTTGEYTAYHGGEKSDALAAINATITRVNQVFETDLGLTLELVENNDLVIYTDAATDPYNVNLVAQVQNTLNTVIGAGNYDIGHLFHKADYNDGNAGVVGAVCIDHIKGGAFSSAIIPEGEIYDIDYVAHEMGHQFGANHTFSYESEGTIVQAEPGSGTTIMGYAGITGPNDVAEHTDDYYHYHSISQISEYLSKISCAEEITTANRPPVIVPVPDFVIPRSTAFVLTANAYDTDADDVLTYTWEQTDSGIVTNTSFGPTNINGANFRSLKPTVNPTRYFPRLPEVLLGNLTQTNPRVNSAWESVSDVEREMNFALTVRDNASSGGLVSSDLIKVQVVDVPGPFTVNSQASNEEYEAGSVQNISWNVEYTNMAPINATGVDIYLSTDGGLTFPVSLAKNIPNNGSRDIIVPGVPVPTTKARIMVKAGNNIFYAVNSTDFSINASKFILDFSNLSYEACLPNNIVASFDYKTFLGFSEEVTFSVTNAPEGLNVAFSQNTATSNDTKVDIVFSNALEVVKGNYPITVTAISASITREIVINLNIYDGVFSNVALTFPANGFLKADISQLLVWEHNLSYSSYDIQIATDSEFTPIIESETVVSSGDSSYLWYNALNLKPSTTYYWRVKPKNICGEGDFSAPYSFTTKNASILDMSDEDNDGIFNNYDLCPNTPEGAEVDIKGCLVYRFEPNNFSIQKENSCSGNNNGSIEIDAVMPMNYTVTVIRKDIVSTAEFADFYKIEDLTAGTYNVCIVGTDGERTYEEYCFDEVIAELDSSDYVFSDVVLISPENGFLEAEVGQFLKWEHNLSYSSYDIQIATDSEFTPIIESETVVSSGDSSYLWYNALNLKPSTTYYWRVKPKNICGEGDFSAPYSFTTKNASILDMSDEDNDGIFNNYDLCPNTPEGAEVDIKGCLVYRFEPNNFSIQKENSCSGNNNGSIEIDAVMPMNYTVTVIRKDIVSTAEFADFYKIEDLTAGTYNVCIVGTDGERTYEEYCFDEVIAELDSSDYVFSDVVLMSPTNDFLEAEVDQFLKWEHNLSYSSYDIQIATDSEFTPIIESETVVSSGDSYLRYNALNLEPLTTYYWRVKPKNICGEGNFSDPFSFTTKKARFNTDNFSVKIESESCRDRNNGSIEITAKTSMNYTVTVKGNGIDYSADFTSSHKIENLNAGTYSVCIVADVYKEYCFGVVVTEPSPLGVSSKLSIDGKQLALRLSGSAQYNIALNGVVLQTDKYEMALGLKNGANTLKVYSDIPCQGIYEQQIFVSDKPVIYPNPFSDFIDIFLGSMQKEVQITIHTANGQLVSDKNHPVYSNGLKLNFIELPQGVYFLNIKGKTVKGAYKIIKK